MDQVLRADRAGWVRLAEKVDSLKRRLDSSLPLDAALDELRMDPATIFHLMPLPLGKADKPFERPSKVPPVKKDASPKKTTKGKGKGRGKSSKGRMPTELVGLHQNPSKGCSFADPGADCNKGCHVCMRCFGQHSAHQCPNAQKPWLGGQTPLSTKNFDTAGQLRSFDAQQPRSRSPSVGPTADRRVCDKFDADNVFQEKLFSEGFWQVHQRSLHGRSFLGNCWTDSSHAANRHAQQFGC